MDALYFGANAWGELFDLAAFWEEIFESVVGGFAVLNVGKWLQRGVFLAVVPRWEVLWVL